MSELVRQEQRILAIADQLDFPLGDLAEAYHIEVIHDLDLGLRRAHTMPFDLVFLYLVKDFDALLELSLSIRAQYPQVKVLIACGFGDRRKALEACKLDQISQFISKPWREEELPSFVASIFEAGFSYDQQVAGGADENSLLWKVEERYPGLTQGVWDGERDSSRWNIKLVNKQWLSFLKKKA